MNNKLFKVFSVWDIILKMQTSKTGALSYQLWLIRQSTMDTKLAALRFANLFSGLPKMQ